LRENWQLTNPFLFVVAGLASLKKTPKGQKRKHNTLTLRAVVAFGMPPLPIQILNAPFYVKYLIYLTPFQHCIKPR